MTFDFNMQPGQKRTDRYSNKKDMTPQISIITVFTRNPIKYFVQSFNSIVNQTYPYFEWLIITESNNVKELAEIINYSDKRIRIIPQNKKTLAALRNYGSKKCQTKYLMFFSLEEIMEPTLLESLYIILQRHKEADWAYTNTAIIGSKNLIQGKKLWAKDIVQQNVLPLTALIRKQAFELVGGFTDLGDDYNSEWDFWLKLLGKGKYPVYLSLPLLWKRKELTSYPQKRKIDNVEIERNILNVPSEISTIEHYGEKEKKFAGMINWETESCFPFKKDKIHILFFFPHMVMGGADQFNLDLIAGLDKNHFDMTIITTLPEENEWRQKFSLYVEDIFDLPRMLDVQEWPAFIKYIIQTRSIDIVVNTNSYYSYYLIPWLRLQFPRIALVDYIHMEEWYYRTGGFARPSGMAGAVLDKTYVCNENTKKVLVKHFKRLEDSIQTIYIGVDEKKYKAEKCCKDIVYKCFPQLDPDRPIILFPCRICSQKRPFLMLEIAKCLQKLAFVVVGDGPQLMEIKKKVKIDKLENVVFFAQRQEDMRPWYKAAKITLICSLKEGISLTAYESLSMETPVVTSNTGGQAELVNDQTGRIVPLLQNESEEDYREFSKQEINLYVTAIKDILQDEKEYSNLCKNCRERIEQHFTLNSMVIKMTQEFCRLTSIEEIEKRIEKAKLLEPYKEMFEQLVELFADYENMERTSACLQGYKDAYQQKGEPALTELERIRKMKSYWLAEKYVAFMSKTFMGKIRRWYNSLGHN